MIAQALPEALPLAFGIILIKSGRRLAPKAALLKQPKQDLIGLCIVVICAHGGFGGLGDLDPEIDRGLIIQLQRAKGHSHQLGGILDQGRLNPFLHHAQPFVDIGDDAAVGVKEPSVIHHNRRFANLPRKVQGFRHRSVAGFCAFDNFHQRHFLNRAEKVDANKLVGPRAGFCELCYGQS